MCALYRDLIAHEVFAVVEHSGQGPFVLLIIGLTVWWMMMTW